MDFGSRNTFTRKIHAGQKLYIKKKFTSRKSIKAVINTENVIIYASNAHRCSIPDEECYEYICSIHDSFIYEPQDASAILIFTIKGLDFAEFTLTLIDSTRHYIKM